MKFFFKKNDEIVKMLKQEREADFLGQISVFSLLALPLLMVFVVSYSMQSGSVSLLKFLAQALPLVAAIILGRWIATIKNYRYQERGGLILLALVYISLHQYQNPISNYPWILGIASAIGMAALALVNWSQASFIIVMLISYAPSCIQLIYMEKLSGLEFLSYATLLAISAAVGLLVRIVNQQSRVREVKSRLGLYNELNEREVTIIEKSIEGIKLTELAKQFSPQIVEGLASGKLSLNQKCHTSEICVVFVDIVGSTEKMNEIKKDHVNRVISMFMDHTIRSFLKYDITIDKFLGDGVLAFSNDPVEQNDYVERVLLASLEIRQKIAENQDSYAESWQGPFQVRFGVASGLANVGFYGHDDFFRSYTAVGRPINLASRLCQLAEKNEILISQELAQKLDKTQFFFKHHGDQMVKGFGKDVQSLYTLLGSSRLDSSLEQKNIKCEFGHESATIAVSQTGIYSVECKECTKENSPNLLTVTDNIEEHKVEKSLAVPSFQQASPPLKLKKLKTMPRIDIDPVAENAESTDALLEDIKISA